MAKNVKPFAVVADGGACITHCASLAGAIRSARGFAPSFTSIVIRHDGQTVRVIR